MSVSWSIRTKAWLRHHQPTSIVSSLCATLATGACLACLSSTAKSAAPEKRPGTAAKPNAAITRPTNYHFDSYAGADVGAHHWLLYSGVTVAPFDDVHKDGVRLRIGGGYGGYRYQSFSSTNSGTAQSQSFDVETNYLAALVGYQQKLGIITAKAFVGAAQIDHKIHPGDRGNRVNGSQIGIKGVVELWADLSPLWYGSLDLAYTTAHRTRSGRLRLGYRITPDVSAGIEGRVNQDAQADYKVSEEEDAAFRQQPLDYVLVGAFARYEWITGEVSASVGLNAADLETTLSQSEDDLTAYGTLNVLFRF